MRLTHLASLLILACALLFSPSAAACSCVAPPPPDKALTQATAVFVGKVVRVDPTAGESLTATFEVTKAWKGIEMATAQVSTNAHGTLCGYAFEVGKEYVVYADGKTELSTSACTRTKPAAEAAEDFKALGDPKQTFAPAPL